MSHNAELGMVIYDVEGIQLSTLTPAHSWNGTIPAATECYMAWGFALTTIYEENWNILFGVFGLCLLIAGLVCLAYGFKKYSLTTWSNKETLLDNNILIFAIPAIFIGAGMIIIWMMG